MDLRISPAQQICAVIGASLAVALSATTASASEPTTFAQDTPARSADETNPGPDFWFEAPSGIRTFSIENNVIVPHIKDTDRIELAGNLINVYDPKDGLVASIAADLSEGMALREADGVIYVGSEDGAPNRCIDNKWVGLGINVAADALVCTPFGLATGGGGGFACGAAVATGVTAASC